MSHFYIESDSKVLIDMVTGRVKLKVRTPFWCLALANLNNPYGTVD
jgi:hypothetical protein